MRGVILLGALALACPLSAQSAVEIPIVFGSVVQVQRTGAAAWIGGKVGSVGDCLTLQFDDDPKLPDGYIMHSFKAVAAVRVGDATRGWHVASADQLARLQSCAPEVGQQAAATPAECGSDPLVARSAVLGFLYGLGMNGADHPIWGPYAALDQKEVVPILIGSECSRIVAALIAERAKQGAAPDTLPIKGVLDLGGIGYVVSRGVGPAGPSGRSTISTALLSRALELKSYQSFTY